MHLSIVTPRLKYGGAEKQAINLLKEFHKNEIKTDLLFLSSENNIPDEVPRKTNLFQFGREDKSLELSNLPFAVKDISRYLKNEKPDVLLCFDNYAGVYTILARKLTSLAPRIVITLHDHMGLRWEYNYNQISRLTIPKVLKTAYDQLNEDKDKIIPVSKEAGDNFLTMTGLSKKNIKTIYNPTILPKIFIQSREGLNHPWLTNKDIPVLVAVGRLDDPKKGFLNLLKAFRELVKKRSARLIIIGDHKEESQLPELISKFNLEDKVDLPGYIENPYPYFKQSDVFVLSSIWEGLPGVLIEALALTPSIVSTDCPSGPKEILEDGKWGRLVPVNNHHAMSKAIIEALDNLQAKRAPKEAWERFTYDRVIDQYMKVLFPDRDKQIVGNI